MSLLVTIENYSRVSRYSIAIGWFDYCYYYIPVFCFCFSSEIRLLRATPINREFARDNALFSNFISTRIGRASWINFYNTSSNLLIFTLTSSLWGGIGVYSVHSVWFFFKETFDIIPRGEGPPFFFSTHILPVLLIQYFGSSWPALCAKFQLKKLKLTLAFPFLSHIHPDISPTITASCFSFSYYKPPLVFLPLLLKLCPRTVSVSCWLLFDHHILFVQVNNQTPAENGKKKVKCSFSLFFWHAFKNSRISPTVRRDTRLAIVCNIWETTNDPLIVKVSSSRCVLCK